MGPGASPEIEVFMPIHPGIMINRIPAEGAGGLIFALGFGALFLISVPAFVPVVAACVLGGFSLALVRGHVAPVPPTDVGSAAPLFIVGAGLALLAFAGFPVLVAGCLTGGLGVAYLRNRAALSRRLVSIRPTSS
jgi:hypothetical protein